MSGLVDLTLGGHWLLEIAVPGVNQKAPCPTIQKWHPPSLPLSLGHKTVEQAPTTGFLCQQPHSLHGSHWKTGSGPSSEIHPTDAFNQISHSFNTDWAIIYIIICYFYTCWGPAHTSIRLWSIFCTNRFWHDHEVEATQYTCTVSLRMLSNIRLRVQAAAASGGSSFHNLGQWEEWGLSSIFRLSHHYNHLTFVCEHCCRQIKQGEGGEYQLVQHGI